MPRDEIVLYGTELSGHAHRVALLLRALDLPYRFECAPLARNGRGSALVQANAGIAASRRRVRLSYLALDPKPLPSQNSKPTQTTQADPGSGCPTSLCR
jgi:hypothetical protein